MDLTNPLTMPVQVRLPRLVSDAAAGRPATLSTSGTSGTSASSTTPTARAAVADTAPVAVSTYGWDTVFAIRLADVNQAIARSAASPPDFSYVPADASCALRGRFGSWRVRRGGSGAIVHLELPVVEGQLDWRGESYRMDGAVATVEVQLDYLPLRDGGRADAGPQRLVLRTGAAVPRTERAASVTELRFAGDGPGFLPQALMVGALQEWVNANLEAFAHVFAVVDLNRTAERGQFRWLAPTATSYAYADGPDDESSVLGVLSMTGGRGADRLAAQITSEAIPAGSRAGFLVAAERLLAELVLPALPRVFPGSAAGDFAMSPDDTAVVNVRPVRTETVSYAGMTYQPEVQQLRITLNANEIVVDTLTSVDIGLGAVAHVKNTSYQSIRLATTPSGGQTLTWADARPPVSDHWTTMDPGVSIAVEVVGLIVLALLTVLTDGAVLVVALIVVALLVGLAEATPELVADVVGGKVSDDSPALSLLALNATDPIVWSGAGEFALDSATLNGALQLGGDPMFTA